MGRLAISRGKGPPVAPPPTTPTLVLASTGATPPWTQPDISASGTKPVLNWAVGCTKEVIVPGSPYLIVIYADASTQNVSGQAAITTVEVGGDIPTTTLTGPSVVAVDDGKGSTVGVLGWPFYVDPGAFTSGTANIFARATATDGTMVTRVIGGAGGYSGWTVAEDACPMQLLPRATQFTWDKTVGSGKDFATLQAALTQLKTDAPLRPRITLHDSGTQTLTQGNDSTTQLTTTEGYCVIRTANSGVTATVQVGSAFDPLNTGDNWSLWPGCEQIRWCRGIAIDTHTWTVYKSSTNTRPVHFFGCRVFDSAGSRANVVQEWNGQQHPTLFFGNAYTGSGFYVYSDNTIIDYVEMGGGTYRFRHNTVTGTYINKFLDSRLIIYSSMTNTGLDPIQYRVSPPTDWGALIVLTYTDSVGATNCYFNSGGADWGGTPYIEIFESSVSKVKVEWPNSSGNYKVYQPASGGFAGQKTSDVISLINSRAVTNMGGRLVASFAPGVTDANPWPFMINNCGALSANLKGTVIGGQPAGTGAWTLRAGWPGHSEWSQNFPGSINFPTNDNYVVARNTLNSLEYASRFFNSSNMGTYLITDNVILPNFSLPAGAVSSIGGRQFVVRNNYFGDGFLPANDDVSVGAWSQITRNAWASALSGASTGGAFPNGLYKYNLFVGGTNPNTGGGATVGNVALANFAAWQGLVTNFASNNFTPLAAGAYYSNQVTQDAQSYTIDNLLRASTDIMGPYRG